MKVLAYVSSPGYTIHFWNLDSGKELHARPEHEGPIHTLSWFPDRRLVVSGSDDSHIRIWDTAKLVPVTPLKYPFREPRGHPPGGRLRRVQVAPNGKTIAIASVNGVAIYPVNGGARQSFWRM